MIGMTNTEGLGLSDNDAILRVQAPANSIVTISKGSIIKHDEGHENKDDPSQYDYYFLIHSSQFDATNPWTITGTLGSEVASKTIIIKEADEYDVLLHYPIYLFKEGDEDGWLSKGWTAYGQWQATAPSISYPDGKLQIDQTGYHSGIAYYYEMIDLTQIDTVTAHGTFQADKTSGSSGINTGCGIYIFSNVSGSGKYPEQAVAQTPLPVGTSTDYDLSVDVSALIGQYYVALGIIRGESGNHYTVDEVRAY